MAATRTCRPASRLSIAEPEPMGRPVSGSTSMRWRRHRRELMIRRTDGGTRQMVHGEANCALRFLVAIDQHVAGGPARIPRSLVRGQYGAPAQRAVACQRGAGGRGGILLRRISTCHRNETVELAICPAADRQRQAHRSENGRSAASTSLPTRSVAAPVIATPLRVPSVRQAPRSCSRRSGSIPRPAIAKLASSLTSTPSRSRRVAEVAAPPRGPPATGGVARALWR